MSRHDLRQEVHKQQRVTNIIAIIIGLILLSATIAILLIPRSPAEIDSLAQDVVVPVEVNYPAPDISGERINGNIESLKDYRGKIVLINVWATWCPPCKAEMPEVVAFYNAYADQGFVVIAVNAAETRQQIGNFLEQYKMIFPVWLDPNEDAIHALKNRILPSSYAIDRTGTMRLVWSGTINRATLEKYIPPLLEE